MRRILFWLLTVVMLIAGIRYLRDEPMLYVEL